MICNNCNSEFTSFDLFTIHRNNLLQTKSCTVSATPQWEYAANFSDEDGNTKLKEFFGVKHDDGKPDLSMVSFELVEAVAQVRMFGAKKYSTFNEDGTVKVSGRNNWKKGFKVTRSCAAALRHIFSFLNGETNDSESGLSHLAHAVCCLEHALYDMKHHANNDDRGDK